MQQDVTFLGDICILIEIRLKYEHKILLSSSRAFSLSTPTFSLSTLRSVTDGQCGQLPIQVLSEWKAPLGSSVAPHYLPTQFQVARYAPTTFLKIQQLIIVCMQHKSVFEAK